jgi:hypothetical protein
MSKRAAEEMRGGAAKRPKPALDGKLAEFAVEEVEEDAANGTGGDASSFQESVLFALRFSHIRSLKALIRVLSRMLASARFRVVCEEQKGGFTGIEVKELDESQTSLVVARLSASLTGDTARLTKPNLEFALDMSKLIKATSPIDNGVSNFQMGRLKDPDNYIFFEEYSITGGSRRISRRSEVPINDLGDAGDDGFSVNPLSYNTVFSFSIAELKKIAKHAIDLNSEFIIFRIMKSRKGHTYFLVHIVGDIYEERSFEAGCDVEKVDGKAVSIMCKKDGSSASSVFLEDLTQTFVNVYRVDTISQFASALDQHQARMLMCMEKDKPLVLTCSLGDEHSYVTVAVSAQADDGNIDRSRITTFRRRGTQASAK